MAGEVYPGLYGRGLHGTLENAFDFCPGGLARVGQAAGIVQCIARQQRDVFPLDAQFTQLGRDADICRQFADGYQRNALNCILFMTGVMFAAYRLGGQTLLYDFSARKQPVIAWGYRILMMDIDAVWLDD
jgi:hypothetical protein